MVQRRRTVARTALVSLMLTVLVACGDGVGNPMASTPYGLSYALSVDPEVIWFGGEKILVYDRPEKNAMLVYNQWTPWWSDYSLEQWTDIAADYIQQSGRDCEIIESNRLWPGEVEFKYACG